MEKEKEKEKLFLVSHVLAGCRKFNTETHVTHPCCWLRKAAIVTPVPKISQTC